MSILMVQLGDIHIRSKDDLALARAQNIGATIAQEVAQEVQTILLVYSGDLVFSGLSEQFVLAGFFVDGVEKEIRDRIGDIRKIVTVCVPGNHDCDFSNEQDEREKAILEVKGEAISEPSFLNTILFPLQEYFKYAKQIFKDMHSNSVDMPFYTFVDIVDNDKTVRIHLLNTAWMSSLQEKPGSLFFPVDEIPQTGHEYDFGVAVMHHPLNWFRQPDSMRQLKRSLNNISSIVFNGHEHVAEASKEETLFGSNDQASQENETVYINGGVIQEDGDNSHCTFNTVVLDLADQNLQIKNFEFQDNNIGFFKCSNSATIDVKNTNSSIGDTGAVLGESIKQFLDDPGAPITHPSRDPRNPITLGELFVTPDLWEFSGKKGQNQQRQINAENVVDEIFKSDKVLIEGLEKSGKTCLLKTLFNESVKAGKLPLYIEGARLPKSAAALREFLRKSVLSTYYKFDPDFYEQLPKNRKVIIIDDANDIQLNEEDYEVFIQFLDSNFGLIIIGAEELVYQHDPSSAFLTGVKISGYRQLRLLGLGEVLRKRFVKNWLELADEAHRNVDQEEIDRICSLLNLIIRTQLLPTYPIFILLLLQQSDIQTASVQSGSFGKLFEGVVTAILYKSSYSRIDIQAKYYYLSAFGKELHNKAAKSISKDDMSEWHKKYWDNVDIDNIKFEILLRDLISLGILENRQGTISFRYDYYYCFFVAYSISRELHKEEAVSLVSTLTQSLHHKISADIVLFLVHLTGNPVVIDKMISTCDSLFSESALLGLDEEFLQLQALGGAVNAIEIQDDPVLNVDNENKRKDAVVVNRMPPTKSNLVNPPSPEDDRERYLFQLHAASKSIQILGQALRNISGSAEKDTKERAITSVVSLSRRILGEFFTNYQEENIEELVQFIAELQKENNPDLILEDLKKQVHKHLYGQAQLVCFAMIRLLSHSIGSNNLSNTIDRLLDDSLPINQLVKTNYWLEVKSSSQPFPKLAILQAHKQLSGNDFNIGILRFLVAHHMYLFNVQMADKQAVASKLNIKLLPRDVSSRHKQLTSDKK